MIDVLSNKTVIFQFILSFPGLAKSWIPEQD
jgi:hypothetical protein